jgi:hypothetical protein
MEIKPTGQKEFTVNFIDAVDYPLVPILKDLKHYIAELEAADGLPD